MSGLAPATGGRLSAERAAELDRRLADLQRARDVAAVEIRDYVAHRGADMARAQIKTAAKETQ